MPQLDATQIMTSFVLSAIIGYFTGYYADQKGRDFTTWFILGLLFNFFATILLFFLPSIKKEENIRPTMTIAKPDPAISISQPQQPISPLNWKEEENKLWYYLDQNHEQVGPVSIIALRNLWNSGLLGFNSYVWAEGMERWQKVDQLTNLKEALSKHSL
ncbi:GYF domain-containing protein [Candidatus Protochlamydia amoebophila]|nr:GYF domain-containing protein [Candidatus Protochlamydia amoebophila]